MDENCWYRSSRLAKSNTGWNFVVGVKCEESRSECSWGPSLPLHQDAQTARLWALVKATCERKGRPIAILDGWIAATALRLGVPLVTNNVRDFQPVDNLTVITSSR